MIETPPKMNEHELVQVIHSFTHTCGHRYYNHRLFLENSFERMISSPDFLFTTRKQSFETNQWVNGSFHRAMKVACSVISYTQKTSSSFLTTVNFAPLSAAPSCLESGVRCTADHYVSMTTLFCTLYLTFEVIFWPEKSDVRYILWLLPGKKNDHAVFRVYSSPHQFYSQFVSDTIFSCIFLVNLFGMSRLINALSPGAVKKVDTSNMPFKMVSATKLHNKQVTLKWICLVTESKALT